MNKKPLNYNLSYLEQLEAETIFVIREAVSQFDKLCLLFSGGKDSLVLLHIARKAFWPSQLPFELLHVDTGHNFRETIEFRDKIIKKYNLILNIESVEELIKKRIISEEKGPLASRNKLQSFALLNSIEKNNFDCCFGGARRDEDKARSKERSFSFRDEFGEWDPKNQRPELWNLFNGKKSARQNFRVFPLSNWTEFDVWNYIKIEKIEIPKLYFSHKRKIFRRNNTLLYKADFMELQTGEKVEIKNVRFRTIGDITCTGAMLSDASNVNEIIDELSKTKFSERGSRIDDKNSETSMEDRKKDGYF